MKLVFTGPGEMKKWIESLVYRKSFFAFLAAVLWFDWWTDLEDVIDTFSPREVLSLALSTTGAILVTVVFLDLQLGESTRVLRRADIAR
jgi:hypothetical protein